KRLAPQRQQPCLRLRPRRRRPSAAVQQGQLAEKVPRPQHRQRLLLAVLVGVADDDLPGLDDEELVPRLPDPEDRVVRVEPPGLQQPRQVLTLGRRQVGEQGNRTEKVGVHRPARLNRGKGGNAMDRASATAHSSAGKPRSTVLAGYAAPAVGRKTYSSPVS